MNPYLIKISIIYFYTRIKKTQTLIFLASANHCSGYCSTTSAAAPATATTATETSHNPTICKLILTGTRAKCLIFQNCYNEDPCCNQWSRQNECRTNTVYMNRYCRKSCGLCQSNDNNRGVF